MNVVGIDIGGTSVKFGLFQNDKLTNRLELPTETNLVSVIKNGLNVCYVFFVSTVFLKLTEYSNRFIVNYFLQHFLFFEFWYYKV